MAARNDSPKPSSSLCCSDPKPRLPEEFDHGAALTERGSPMSDFASEYLLQSEHVRVNKVRTTNLKYGRVAVCFLPLLEARFKALLEERRRTFLDFHVVDDSALHLDAFLKVIKSAFVAAVPSLKDPRVPPRGVRAA